MSRPASCDRQRRQLLKTLGGGGALWGAPLARSWAQAPAQTLTVLTAYPDEVVSRFSAAFGAAYPQYRLKIVWRMPHDALPYLQAPGQNGVDVYWSASPRSFAQLKKQGAWQKLPADLRSLPGRIGGTQMADPDGDYVATEVAGYGYAIHAERLQALGLPVPQDWTELCDARYAGHIALPDPSRVGFAPVMVDILLQAYGWQRGWALWNEIAGNAKLVNRGSTFVTDEVGAQGSCALGLTIDFFAASAIANGAPIRFVYPRHSGLNPGQVGITASCTHREAALAFVGFLLSETGQSLLLHPDLRKLPVRPSVYKAAPTGSFNPFLAAEAGQLNYDGQRTQARLGLLGALFEQCLSQPHEELLVLWRRIHHAETGGRPLKAVRETLCRMPLDEAQSARIAGQEFKRRLESQSETKPAAIEAQWAAFAREQRQRAAQLLDAAGA